MGEGGGGAYYNQIYFIHVDGPRTKRAFELRGGGAYKR